MTRLWRYGVVEGWGNGGMGIVEGWGNDMG